MIRIPAATDSAISGQLAVYVPGPELSPSTEQLFFENILPGESRTLFMDLANLGEGVIILDSLTFPAEIVSIALPLQELRPGQFVRFPITYTQADLDTHQLDVSVHWESRQFAVSETLILRISAVPRPPLIVEPASVSWPQSYAGSKNTKRVLLQNVGTQPVVFPESPVLPADVELAGIPQIIAGEDSAPLTLVWSPSTAGPLTSRFRIPYYVEGVSGAVEVQLRGEALQPAHFLTDTLDFASVFAGSNYHQRVAVGNGSGQTVVLQRLNEDHLEVEEFLNRSQGGKLAEWLEIPDRLEVSPEESAYLEVGLAPREAGTYQTAIHFSQQQKTGGGPSSARLPNLVLIVKAEVQLPISAEEDHVDLGDDPVLETAVHSINVVNRGAEALDISVGLVEEQAAFSIPPLVYRLSAGEKFDIPLYFRPTEMQDYVGTVQLRYATFGVPQQLQVALRGRGLDRPLLKVSAIPDVVLEEDFPGRYMLADLTEIFTDANHRLTYYLRHSFGDDIRLTIDGAKRLTAKSTPDYHGRGDVVVEAVNELGHVVADTFQLVISPVNDLPRLMTSINDIVLREDPDSMVVGRLSEIFVDPDRVRDTVVTHYTIYSPTGDDAVRLTKVGDELVLTVEPDWYGDRSFVVSARDAADTSAVVFDEFKVSVLAVNDPPTIAPLPNLSLVEDDTVHMDWLPYIHDVDNGYAELQLNFTAAGAGTMPLSFEKIVDLATVLRPRANWYGSTRVRLTVTDTADGTASRDFSVTVIPENDPPGSFRLLEPVTLEWEQRLRFSGRDTLITFKWEPSPNVDPGDDLHYTLQLMDTTYRVLKELPAGFSTSIITQLDTSGIFLWTVQARDGEEAVGASDTLPLVLESLSSGVTLDEPELPFSFGPNYPNPFSTVTRIEYTIPQYSDVVITVYDAMGRKVRILLAESQFRGRHIAEWDGRDAQGVRVASGPYVAEIRAGSNIAYLKLLVVH
ncbi:MAG: T9SS type A sorting domain-containing protein [Fidelibacterota bacterium]|nr:MAG: T9SS type A sorting domain-containing protein [Candidatus Neomarinimicrobiota bacterium]